MLRLLYDPVAEIKSFKKEGIAKALLYLLASSLMLCAGLLLFSFKFKLIPDNLLIYAIVGGLFGIIALYLVFAFFFSVAMHVLDGNGGFYEGLAATVLALAAPSVAALLAGAIAFIPFGIYLSVLLMMYGIVLSTAVFLRAGKELYNADYFAVFAAALVVKLCLYGSIVLFILL